MLDHRLRDPGEDHRGEDPRQPRDGQERAVGRLGAARCGLVGLDGRTGRVAGPDGHDGVRSGLTQRRSRTSWRTVGRSATSAWRRAGSNAASVSTRVPRAPTARAIAAKSTGPRSVAMLDPAASPRPAAPGASGSCRSARCRRRSRRPGPSRGRRSRARPSSSRSRRRRRPRRPPGPDGRGRPRSPPAGRSPSRPEVGPRNVPGLRNRKWRASHSPKLPASVATIASSGRSRRSVAIAWPGWTPGPIPGGLVDGGRRFPRRPILGVDGAPGVDTRGVEHGSPRAA